MFKPTRATQARPVLTRAPYWDYTELDPIRVQFQVDAVDGPTLRTHLEGQTRDIEHAKRDGRRSYLIIAAQGDHRPTPEVRKIQAQWMEQHHDLIAETSIGMGFVIDNPVVRGALTAIFWVSRAPVPYKVHPNLAEALAHGVTVCRQLGLVLPPEALRPDAADRARLALERALIRRVAL